MKVHQEELELATRGRGLVDCTGALAAIAARSGVQRGLLTAFLQHTSASLVIQENADPAVLRDLQRWAARVAPESPDWEHDDEGPDDMPAHLRAAMSRTSEQVPVRAGTLALGTWQAVYVWEHRSAPHRRRLVVTVIGE